MIHGIVAGGNATAGPPIGTPAAFFENDYTNGTGWVSSYWPSAVQHNGKTYVIWQFIGSISGAPIAARKGVHIAAFDHSSGTWSDRHTAFSFTLTDDNHGVPSMCIDADGYIHCFGGSHSDPLRYSVSTNAEDVTKWTRRPNISGSATYAHPVLVGSTIYLFARNDTDSSRRTLTLRTSTPSAGVGTFGSEQTILDLGADSRVYATEAYVVGTAIHIVVSRANAADTVRKHIYYLIYETTTGEVTNFDASVSVASGSLPVDLTAANASFRIFDSGSNDGAMPSMAFDDSGDAHVLFCDGTSSPYPLKHMKLSGGVWSTPVTIANVDDRAPGFGAVTTFSMVRGASGSMQAWYPLNGTMTRRILSAAGIWGAPQTVVAAGTYNVASNISVLNADPELRVIFSENRGSSTDTDAALLKLYGHGDSGFVAAIDQTQIDSNWPHVVLLSAGGARDASTSFIDDSPHSYGASFSGNVQVDTAQTKFSQASFLFDGSGDYLSLDSSSAWSVAAGDFTFELWFRPNELGRVQALLNRRPASGNSEWAFSMTNANVLAATLYNGSGAVASMVGATTVATGNWYHAALCRSGTTSRLFLNGTLQATAVQSGSPTSNSQPLAIGRDWANPGTRDFNGWIEEVRITRAARYTAAFTPPAAVFPRR